MARSIKEIQQTMIDAVTADPLLSVNLTSQSSTAIWRLWTYVVAVAQWTIENFFDLFRIETDEKIATLKPHSLRWYAVKSKAFLYGSGLVLKDESDEYDTTGVSEDDIARAQIVAHAAVVELERGLRIKVAKNAGGSLDKLDPGELQAFVAYMTRVKDAGVKLFITSDVADGFQLDLQVYYDPLVLNSDGARLDGTNITPVQNAVKEYLKNLPFNGVLVTEYLTDALQKVDGVVVPHITRAAAKYAGFGFSTFTVKYTPDAGYLKIYNEANDGTGDLNIQFIPQNVIN